MIVLFQQGEDAGRPDVEPYGDGEQENAKKTAEAVTRELRCYLGGLLDLGFSRKF